MNHEIRVGLAVCTPHPMVRGSNGSLKLDTITVEWQRARAALATPTNINVVEMHADGMEVGVARNKVACKILQNNPVPEFLFFLDNDVIVPYDAVTKLMYRARCFKDYDIFAGVYCCKWMNPPDPLIYAGDGCGPFWDWKIGDILTTDQHGITSTHMGLVLIRTSLFKTMVAASYGTEENPLFKTVNEKIQQEDGVFKTRRGTEDIYFCNKATQEFGAKILVDTSVLAGHIDKNSGVVYGLPFDSQQVTAAEWIKNQDSKEDTKEDKKLKKAIDLGFGGNKREFEGYKTYTTDLRADTKPDYVQDTRLLNFPEEYWDLVTSSHHLEHFGRWEQENIWKEMFRVLKPGGYMDHVVPDIGWAAEHIRNNDDKSMNHVYNVLYGAQEMHGYERELNTHYFGYTKKLAKALAEGVGLVDVTVENWQDNDKLGYNMIIKGRKPKKGEKPKNKKKEETKEVVKELVAPKTEKKDKKTKNKKGKK